MTPTCQLSDTGKHSQAREIQFCSSKITVRCACCVGIIFGTNGSRKKVDVTPSRLFNLAIPSQRIKITYISTQKTLL